MAIVKYITTFDATLAPTGLYQIKIEPALKYFKSFPVSVNLPFQCPAFTGYYYNTYALLSPFDIEVFFDEKGLYLNVNGKDFSRILLTPRCSLQDRNNICFSIGAHSLFYSDESVIIEQLPSNFYDYNGYIIPGTFNIGKWYRSIEYAYVYKDTSKPFIIKKGEPLSFVRFIPEDGSKVELQEEFFSREIQQVVSACVNTKAFQEHAGKPLEQLYELAEPVIAKYKQMRDGKCPFNHDK